MLKALTIALALLYPLAVYLGMQFVEPRILGSLLLLMVLLRHGQRARAWLATVQAGEWLILAGSVSLALAIIVSNSESLLRAYPVLLSVGMLLLFARSLRYPPTVIERIARLSEPELSLAGVGSTRRVTQVWCGFFSINGLIAAASIFASREWWLLYNGLIAYVLMGALFIGEWLVRQRFRRAQATLAAPDSVRSRF